MSEEMDELLYTMILKDIENHDIGFSERDVRECLKKEPLPDMYVLFKK